VIRDLVRRSALLAPVGALVGAGAFAGWQVPVAIGGQPKGARLERMRRSPNFRDGAFHNTVEAVVGTPSSNAMRDLVFGKEVRRPTHAVPLVGAPDFTAAVDGLRVSWLGHATALVEIERKRFLFDPVWSDRVSPSTVVGPKRLHPVPWSLADLPELDAVVISHDHYDHLDLPTVRALLHGGTAPFVVPLGLGNHLRRWGVPDDRIVELDWDESFRIGGLTLTCTEARHFSGRGLRRNPTLWSSWVVSGVRHRVFFGGDTGYTPAFADVGAAHGPFDLTVLPIGAYSDLWPLIHMTPEEAVAAHRDLTGGAALLVPIHWATFNLGFHPWAEPVQRLCTAAAAAGVRIAVPRPGERLDATAPPSPTDWWSAVG
jgi:L-ascorbate metabolism protein UlaG (beta-lactamase superfamily)